MTAQYRATPVKPSGFTSGAARDLSILVGIALGIGIILFRDTVLPGRFSYDAGRIQGIAQGVRSSYGDTNYQRTADIYRFLGLEDHPLLVGMISFAILFAGVAVARTRSGIQTRGVATSLIGPLAIVLGAAFLGTYSKDILALPIAILAILGTRSRRWDLILVAVCIAYAWFFRPYWWLIAAAYVAARIVFRRRATLARVAIFALLVATALGIAVLVESGVSASYYRDIVNAGRINDPDAASMIPGVVDPSGPASLANVLVALVYLVVPIPLLMLGTVYHTILFLLITTIWVCALGPLRQRAELSYFESRALSLVVSFVAVQSLFEPDYGSYLRHLMSMMPVILVLAWRRKYSSEGAA